MENQKEVLADLATNPATLPTPNLSKAKKPEPYTLRIRKMTDKVLLSEVKRKTLDETRRSNGMGIALGTVLEVLMQGHIAGRAPYAR